MRGSRVLCAGRFGARPTRHLGELLEEDFL
jgi:hypothetical protein